MAGGGSVLIILRDNRPSQGRGGGCAIAASCVAAGHRTIDPRVPAMPGWSTSGFHQSGRHCVYQRLSAVQLFRKLREGLAASCLKSLVRREGGACTQFMNGRSRMAVDPRIPTMPGRSTSGFHQPGRHFLRQARRAVRCSASRMKGKLHPSKNRS